MNDSYHRWTRPSFKYFFSRGGWLWANDVSVPRKVTPGLPGWNFFIQCPGLIFLAARWSGPAASASIFSVCLDYILRVCQSLWDSFLYVGKLHWFLYLLLSYFYDPGMFISRWSSNVEWENVGENGISCFLPCILLLYIDWIWTNYCKLSGNFVGAIRTTAVKCRVSFIDLYWLFPTNFRMVFLPHTNTVILLEPYCGTITEPGLPVLLPSKSRVRVTWNRVVVHPLYLLWSKECRRRDSGSSVHATCWVVKGLSHWI